ncbi:unnamed protein product, partial [Ilex paraguariensis]
GFSSASLDFDSCIVAPNFKWVVLNNVTVEMDNPDLRDRAYIYWHLLSIDPEAAKDVVLAEKPVIIYRKPPEAFVIRVKTTQRTEEVEYPDGSERGYSDTPGHAAESGVSSPATESNSYYAEARQRAAPAPVPY